MSADPRNAASSGWRACWSSFVQALTRPSLPATVGFLLVFVVVLGGTVLGVDEGLLASLPEGYLAEDERDQDAFVTHRVLRVAQAPSVPSAVAVIGASAIQHALPRAPVFEEMLAREAGRPVPVHRLYAVGMRLPDYLAIVDQTAERIDGAYVIQVGAGHLLMKEQIWERRRLGLPSAAVDRESASRGMPQERTGNFFLDQREFLLPRLLPALWNLIGGPVEAVPYWIEETPGEEQARRIWEQMLRDSIRLKRLLKNNMATNLEALAGMIRLIESRTDARIVLLASTANPAFLEQVDTDEYYSTMQEFANQHGVEFWNLDAEAGLTADDFHDPMHLQSDEARRRYSEILCRRLTALLDQDPPRKESP